MKSLIVFVFAAVFIMTVFVQQTRAAEEDLETAQQFYGGHRHRGFGGYGGRGFGGYGGYGRGFGGGYGGYGGYGR